MLLQCQFYIPKSMWGNACFSKVHSYQFAMFFFVFFCFSTCKQVIALQAQRTSLAKMETFLHWPNFWTSRRGVCWQATLKKKTKEIKNGWCLESNERGKDGNMRERTPDSSKMSPCEERGIQMNERAATLCLVQWWWGFAYDIHQTSWSFGHFTIDKCKKRLHQSDS